MGAGAWSSKKKSSRGAIIDDDTSVSRLRNDRYWVPTTTAYATNEGSSSEYIQLQEVGDKNTINVKSTISVREDHE